MKRKPQEPQKLTILRAARTFDAPFTVENRKII
jgi:hypothetical protein